MTPTQFQGTNLKAVLPLSLLLALGGVAACGAQQPDGIDESSALEVRGSRAEPAERHDTSPPLQLMRLSPSAEQDAQLEREHPVKKLPRPPPSLLPSRDRVLQSTFPALLVMPAALSAFDGIGAGFTGPNGTFSVNSAPPDTNGDVGPNHYVQTVNSELAIFSKAGAVLYGPVALNTLWSGFGGGCQANNDGDPIVLYDPISDRWVISQFSVSTSPYLQCVAVSKTADPTGQYNRYSFSYTDFPDYPKMGVWPDAYYFTFNMFNAAGTAFLGGKVCAYDRAKMLAGAAATQQCFQTPSTIGGLLAADLDGAALPPAGAPEYVLALGELADQLAFYKFHVDWTTPASSTFTGPTNLATAAYTAACGSTGTCIPQSGTTTKLDSLSDRLMFRLAYRNFGDHEALLTNHSIVAGSSVGVRWYELRLSGGVPSIYQQGTYAPDSNYRWMGSAAFDHDGNIGLGFSLSGGTLKPQVHYAGRLASDPQNQLSQGENTLQDVSGAQTGSLNRWGDYSMLGVDPVDDCTFWYTTEYLASAGSFNWHTRIGTFKFPGCGATPPADDFSIGVNPGALTLQAGGSATSTVTLAITAGAAQAVTLSASGLPAGVTATFAPATITGAGASTLTLTASAAAASATASVVISGAGTATTHAASLSVTVNGTAPANDFSLALAPATGSIQQGATGTATVTTAVTSGSAQATSLAIAGLPAGVTAAFSPASLTGAGTSTLTLSVGASAATGTSTLTVSGTAPSGTKTASYALTVTAAPVGPTQLSNGVATTGIAGATGSQAFFVLSVPAGQGSLVFATTGGGGGDADLYVKFGSQPTLGSYDCRPYTGSSAETCSFTNPAAGNWYVMIQGYSAFSALSLTGTYAPAPVDTTPLLTNGVAVTNISGAKSSSKYWKLAVPAGRTKVVFTLAPQSGATGDADLYVKVGVKPTTSSYTCRSSSSTNTETCTINSPAAGDYYVMVRGYTAFTKVSLKGTY